MVPPAAASGAPSGFTYGPALALSALTVGGNDRAGALSAVLVSQRWGVGRVMISLAAPELVFEFS